MANNLLHQREVVLIPFPFSNLRDFKVRPALVVSNNDYNKKFDDFIGVAITSNLSERDHVVRITNKEMEDGRLLVDSNIKVDKLFTVDQSLIKIRIGRVKIETFNKIKKMLLEII